MSCKKESPLAILAINSAVVFGVFLLFDLIAHVLVNSGTPYKDLLPGRLIFILLFAIPYAHVYNKASRIWRPVPKYVYNPLFDANFTDAGLKFGEAFVCKQALKDMDESDWCKFKWAKVANGIVFNLLLCLAIAMILALFQVILNVVLIDMLHWFRGGEEETRAAVVAGQTVIAGVVLEGVGKTEDNPR